MSTVTFGSISKTLSSITTDIANNIGKHNNFVMITNSNDIYIDKKDPIFLRYDGNMNEWVFVADSTIIDFGYLTENLIVNDESVELYGAPLNQIIWDVHIVDQNNNIVNIVDPKSLFVDKNVLSGLTNYIGQNLSLMYCIGDTKDIDLIPSETNPTNGHYLNEEIDILTYDGPYDMNDIPGTTNTVVPSTEFDKYVYDKIQELETLISKYYSRMLYNTNKILIENDSIKLPFLNIGDIIEGKASIYIDKDDTVIYLEVTCSVSNGIVTFDSDDKLNGMYAKVSYLAEKASPIK